MINAMTAQGTNTLWTEAAEMATELDNLIIGPGESRDSFQKIYGSKKKYFAALNNLKTFGEEVIVAGRTKTRANLYDRGKKYLWLSYTKKMVFGYLQVGSTIPRQEVSYSVRTSFF